LPTYCQSGKVSHAFRATATLQDGILRNGRLGSLRYTWSLSHSGDFQIFVGNFVDAFVEKGTKNRLVREGLATKFATKGIADVRVGPR